MLQVMIHTSCSSEKIENDVHMMVVLISKLEIYGPNSVTTPVDMNLKKTSDAHGYFHQSAGDEQNFCISVPPSPLTSMQSSDKRKECPKTSLNQYFHNLRSLLLYKISQTPRIFLKKIRAKKET